MTACDHQPLTSDNHGWSAVQGPTPLSRTYFSGALVPLSLPLECVTCGGSWMLVLWHGLKLSTDCYGSETSWEVQAKVSCRLCSAWATWHGPQSDLQMTVTCAGWGGALVRPSYEPRLAAASGRPGATVWEVWGTLRPDAISLRDFRKISFEVLCNVMVNFMCQFGWAMVPWHVFKHHCGFFFFCKAVFCWDYNFNLWILSKADCPP